MSALTGPAIDLTDEQRRIVEWGDGPAVVIAGAGTGKTRVIVERVRHLLATQGAGAEPSPDADADPDDPLLPERLLVLTYNVKAAAELRQRIEAAVGVAIAGRMAISNFHSFCQRILTEHAADAGLPPRPDVLDGVAQVLLLRDIRPDLGLVYHSTEWWLGDIVGFINRCKDELASPDHFDAFVAEERRVFEERYGSFEAAADRLNLKGNLQPLRKVRGSYAGVRANERAEVRGEERTYRADEAERTADREARRTIAGTGRADGRTAFAPEDTPRIDALAATYVVDGAALEILRLQELARIYHAYETELARRGALDFGEQIAAVTTLCKTRPNVLRRLQRQYRYLLVDEFQDANIAQIELIELLGRTPDRPDNVMVVGDDDQSIYRFRGASFAAFAEFDARFSKPPAHAPDAPPPGSPTRLRLEQNFRSVRNVLTAADRLIAMNATRFEPDKRLKTDREDGAKVQVITCAGPEDEAVAIVDAIKVAVADGTARGWQDVAVLYRKHKHRDAVVARLRDEDIPYTVVGGLSLFESPEIRDLEQALRAVANPHDDIAIARTMTAGPWRLDALEIVAVSRPARFEDRRLVEQAAAMVDDESVDAGLRAKLRMLLDLLDALNPLTFREGPFTIVERFLERTGQVLDLIAADTLESKRMVTNIASFLRFAADWQSANPRGTLSGFVAYLDAYQSAGGELPTSVELTEDIDGVRLMTLYQAKGLEFPIVFVPSLLDGEWPTKEGWAGFFPVDLLREAVPPGDVHTEEERRLLYVAMTRAQERLVLLTHGGPTATKRPSLFVSEVTFPSGEEMAFIDRTAAADGAEPVDAADSHQPPTIGSAAGLVRRVMPLPTARERRLALRLRASELVGLLESTDGAWPDAETARQRFGDELTGIGRAAAVDADAARAAGLDPLTFRSVAADTGAGANLLRVAPLPGSFSFSAFDVYDKCGLQYAFKYVYRIPEPPDPRPALSFGSTAHAAFEAFTRERRERAARGEPPPTREDLETLFRREWVPAAFGDKTTKEGYERRVGTLLDNFWDGEVASLGEALREELDFELRLDPGEGPGGVEGLDATVIIHGSIDRIDRLPGGGIEVIDYKTGSTKNQAFVDKSLQLSIYALACRDALDLGTPERVTLYFTESATRVSTTRTDEQLDVAHDEILARVSRMRAGEFPALPGDPCRYCVYRAMCPERV